MATHGRQMHLGMALDLFGCHRASWRHPDVPRGDMTDFAFHMALAQKSEQGLFDLLFMADTLTADWAAESPEMLGRQPPYRALDPVVTLSAIAGLTHNIGLVPSINTTYSAPYTVARMLSSLDHVSGGRVGWNLVTGGNPEEAGNFSDRPHPPPAERYERATEFAKVLFGLWDGWDEGAFICDRESGLFYDPAKRHVLNHHGKYFHSRGPLTGPRAPQGRPVTFQAGNSNEGRELAAATADVVFSLTSSIEGARAFYADVKGRMGPYGRSPDQMKILPGVMPFVGATQEEALRKLQVMEDSYDMVLAVNFLNQLFGADLRGYPLDEPVPDLPLSADRGSRPQTMMDKARADGLTLRQLAQQFGNTGHWMLAGTPASIADILQEYFETGAADGFIVAPPYMPGSLDDFVDQVIPELQRRGLFRTAYQGKTLRDHLGLGMP